MRNLIAVTAAALLACAAAAQLSETLEVKVMELEAVVLDKTGKPVEGLTREDFEVRVGGKPVELTNFFAVRKGAAVDDEPGAASASAPTTLPTRLFIFIDERHLRQRSLHYGMKALQQYAADAPDAGVTYALMRYNGSLDVVLRPTNDRKRVLDELLSMKPRPTGLERDDRDIAAAWGTGRIISRDGARTMRLRLAEMQKRETDQTIIALRNVVRIASGMGGRKILLYVSEGLPWTSVPELYMGSAFEPGQTGHALLLFDAGDAMRLSSDKELRELAREAQDAGVAFCTIDAGTRAGSMSKDNLRTSVALLAAQTGGIVAGNQNDLKASIDLLTDQMTTYYSLGIRSPDQDTAKVQVKVRNRPDVRVVTSTRRAIRSRDQTVADAVRARLYLREQQNPLNAKIELVKPEMKDGRCTAVVRVSAPAETLTFAPRAKTTIHFALLDEEENQSAVESVSRDLAQGDALAELVTFTVLPRKYVASFAVVDAASGATSYLQRDLDATSCSPAAARAH